MAEMRQNCRMNDCAFDDWIQALDEDVIQDEYGYERGEFTVYPDHWRSMYDDGLTPQQAFKRALDSLDAENTDNQPLDEGANGLDRANEANTVGKGVHLVIAEVGQKSLGFFRQIVEPLCLAHFAGLWQSFFQTRLCTSACSFVFRVSAADQ